jgi:hypothetical protein
MIFGKIHCTACGVSVALPRPQDSQLNVVCPQCRCCLLKATIGDGYVYILENDLMPGLIKIGMTDRDPFQRAVELSSATGVPAPFEVRAYFFAVRPESIEAAIHEEFSIYRLQRGREFFRISLNDALRQIHDRFAGEVSEITVWQNDQWETFSPFIGTVQSRTPPEPKSELTPEQIAALQHQRAEERRCKQDEQRKQRERELRRVQRNLLEE